MPNSPLYLRIYNDFKRKIENGTFTAGSRLPSEKEICQHYGVSRITSKKAMEKLRNEDYIVRHPGRGTFVSDSISFNSYSGEYTSANGHDTTDSDTKSKPLLGLVLPDFSESYGMEIVTGIEKACHVFNYNFMLKRTFYKITNEKSAITDMYRAGCDGLILMPQHNDYFNDQILRLILDDYPVVIIDREMTGIDTNSVVSDNYQSAYDATTKILSYGHENIAFVSYATDSATSLHDRMQGFRDAFYDHKLYWDNNKFLLSNFNEVSQEEDANKRSKLDLEIIKKFIEENPEVTAFFATEYNFGQLIIEALLHLNYRVPEDYSVISYDGPSSFTGNTFLTRVLQPQEEMGSKAVELLDSIIKKNKHPKKIKLEATLRQGKTLGPVRKHKLK